MDTVKMPGMPKAERVAVYIDGFNLYFGIRDRGWGQYLWLDVCALSARFLQPHQSLSIVRYFTSRVSSPEDKRKRQAAYIDALSTLDGNLLSITYGNYQDAPHSCPKCHSGFMVPNEKQTDVNIAVSMLSDAVRDAFDTALIVSADSDLCPAIGHRRNRTTGTAQLPVLLSC